MENKDDKDYIFIKERVREEPSAMANVIVRVLKLICIGAALALMICFGIVIFGNGFNIFSGGASDKAVKEASEENSQDVNDNKTDGEGMGLLPEQRMKAALVVVKVENYKTEEENEQQEDHETEEEKITLAISDDKEVQETTAASGEVPEKKEKETTTAIKNTQNSQTVEEYEHLGIIVRNDKDVYIALPYDKIENGQYLTVTFCDGLKYEAVVKREDKRKNLTVAMVNEKDIKSSTRESIGEWEPEKISDKSRSSKVWYASMDENAKGKDISIEQGNISCIEANLVTYDFCYTGIVTNIRKKTDNAGFIFDEKGRVVAMAESIYSKNQYEAYVTGVCIQDIANTIEKLVKGNRMNYAGIMGEAVTADMRKLTGEEMPDGVYVTAVDKEASAYKSGLMVGDIIVNVNAKQAKSLKDIQTTLENISANMTLAINIKRKIGTGYNDLTLKIPVESY